MTAPAPLPVYLIHWNAPEWCESAVRSVMDSLDVSVDVTVIDNGQLAPPALRDCLPAGVRVLDAPSNVGYAGGANIALRDWYARCPDGDLCVLGSHDLIVEPDTLARLASTAARHPRAGIVAPVTVAPHATSGGGWTGTRSFQFGAFEAGGVVERDWVRGACLMMRRGCVDDVGPFDERFGSYMEDVDYGLRANDAGWRVVIDADARVSGLGAASDTWIAAITANTVLLGAKRDGWVGAARALTLLTYWMVHALFASVVPWRDAARRALSRRYARQRLEGLARAAGMVRDGRLRAGPQYSRR